jgi:hypothetical protein
LAKNRTKPNRTETDIGLKSHEPNRVFRFGSVRSGSWTEPCPPLICTSLRSIKLHFIRIFLLISICTSLRSIKLYFIRIFCFKHMHIFKKYKITIILKFTSFFRTFIWFMVTERKKISICIYVVSAHSLRIYIYISQNLRVQLRVIAINSILTKRSLYRVMRKKLLTAELKRNKEREINKY